MEFYNVKNDGDIKILEALACEIWRSYWTILLSKGQIEYMIDKFQSYEAIKAQLENEKYIYKVLKDADGSLLGYFGVYVLKEAQELLYLSKMYLKDDHRGKGFGSLMFEEVKKIAAGLNLNRIRLNVNKKNSASINTYEKWGFKTLESVVNDIGQGYVMDDYVMECVLEV